MSDMRKPEPPENRPLNNCWRPNEAITWVVVVLFETLFSLCFWESHLPPIMADFLGQAIGKAVAILLITLLLYGLMAGWGFEFAVLAALAMVIASLNGIESHA